MSKKDVTSLKKKRTGCIAAFLVGSALSALPSASAAVSPDHAVQNLSRYCTACWRNAGISPGSWADCTQEVFARLLQRITPETWGRALARETEEQREFLRAIDAVKKRTQRSHRPAALTQDVADGREPLRRSLDEQRRWVERKSQEHLTPRQHRILSMSLDGWSVHEIADHTRLRPAQVSDEKYKAIRKLRHVV